MAEPGAHGVCGPGSSEVALPGADHSEESSSTPVELLTVGHDWERLGEVLDLQFAVLYGPFGVAREAEWYHPANGSEFVVALGRNGRVLGTARLLPGPGEPSRQVRQVVVAPDLRGSGVGRLLMEAVEATAMVEGAEELWLNSRESAVGFYERLGYACDGEPFVSPLTGIPHRRMRKGLVADAPLSAPTS